MLVKVLMDDQVDKIRKWYGDSIKALSVSISNSTPQQPDDWPVDTKFDSTPLMQYHIEITLVPFQIIDEATTELTEFFTTVTYKTKKVY